MVFSVSGKGRLNVLQQHVIIHRFFEKIERAVLHGTNRHGNISLASQDNDWNLQAFSTQLFLKFEPAEILHPHVKHKAARHSGVISVENSITDEKVCTENPTDSTSQRNDLRIAGSSSTTKTVVSVVSVSHLVCLLSMPVSRRETPRRWSQPDSPVSGCRAPRQSIGKSTIPSPTRAASLTETV